MVFPPSTLQRRSTFQSAYITSNPQALSDKAIANAAVTDGTFTMCLLDGKSK